MKNVSVCVTTDLCFPFVAVLHHCGTEIITKPNGPHSFVNGNVFKITFIRTWIQLIGKKILLEYWKRHTEDISCMDVKRLTFALKLATIVAKWMLYRNEYNTIKTRSQPSKRFSAEPFALISSADLLIREFNLFGRKFQSEKPNLQIRSNRVSNEIFKEFE